MLSLLTGIFVVCLILLVGVLATLYFFRPNPDETENHQNNPDA
jgi:hypothetical protein